MGQNRECASRRVPETSHAHLQARGRLRRGVGGGSHRKHSVVMMAWAVERLLRRGAVWVVLSACRSGGGGLRGPLRIDRSSRNLATKPAQTHEQEYGCPCRPGQKNCSRHWNPPREQALCNPHHAGPWIKSCAFQRMIQRRAIQVQPAFREESKVCIAAWECTFRVLPIRGLRLTSSGISSGGGSSCPAGRSRPASLPERRRRRPRHLTEIDPERGAGGRSPSTLLALVLLILTPCCICSTVRSAFDVIGCRNGNVAGRAS